MLSELQIKIALREALKRYIKLLEKSYIDMDAIEVKGQIQAYSNILGIDNKYIDISRAKQLLLEVR